MTRLIGTALVLTLALALFIGLTIFSGDRVSRMKWRAQFRMKPGPGFATHWDIMFCWSRWAMIVHARHGRPDMGHWRRIISPARHYAVRLGRANLGRKIHAPYEAQMGIIAPPRTRKTRYLTDLVYMHPGAVVSATTRPDVYRNTVVKRRLMGPVHVFNPEGYGGIASDFRIDIVSDCINPDIASKTAAALVGPTGDLGEMAFWADKATQALAALLHAAALFGYDMDAVAAWANRQGENRVMEAARRPGASAAMLANAMEIQGESKSAQSVRMTLGRSLAWVGIPALRDAVTGPGLMHFDASQWTADRGTIYFINSGEDSIATPLFRAVIERIFRDCVYAGSLYPNGKLPVPVGFYLDELTQIASVPLNKWLAYAGGSGIFCCYVIHTPAQLTEVYGEAAARTIWQLTSTKLVLWGNTDPALIEDLSVVLGETDEDKPVRKVQAEFIRRLPRGRGLVVAGNLRPIVVKVRPLQSRIAHRLHLVPSAAPAMTSWTPPAGLPAVIDLTEHLTEMAEEEHGAA
jgi:type IV secretory pathway TraG/TraD family ATPase VirD4